MDSDPEFPQIAMILRRKKKKRKVKWINTNEWSVELEMETVFWQKNTQRTWPDWMVDSFFFIPFYIFYFRFNKLIDQSEMDKTKPVSRLVFFIYSSINFYKQIFIHTHKKILLSFIQISITTILI